MLAVLFSILLLNIPVDSEVFYKEERDKNILLDKVEVDQYNLSYFDSIFIDNEKLDSLMDDLEKSIYRAPKNAELGENNELISEKSGLTLDRNKFEILFREYFYSHKNRQLEVPVRKLHAKVDSGRIKEISARKLGEYATFFKKNNKERSHNIALSAEAINNTVVFPGETFSFNEVVGERTEEKGYKQAPVIVKGELSEDIGGGICQVSSTLFNAVDLDGIQVLERYAHSKSVPYVPEGRDATVSWWGPDFTFKNLYNEPILIRAKAQHGKMIVSIYSSESAEHFNGD